MDEPIQKTYSCGCSVCTAEISAGIGTNSPATQNGINGIDNGWIFTVTFFVVLFCYCIVPPEFAVCLPIRFTAGSWQIMHKRYRWKVTLLPRYDNFQFGKFAVKFVCAIYTIHSFPVLPMPNMIFKIDISGDHNSKYEYHIWLNN